MEGGLIVTILIVNQTTIEIDIRNIFVIFSKFSNLNEKGFCVGLYSMIIITHHSINNAYAVQSFCNLQIHFSKSCFLDSQRFTVVIDRQFWLSYHSINHSNRIQGKNYTFIVNFVLDSIDSYCLSISLYCFFVFTSVHVFMAHVSICVSNAAVIAPQCRNFIIQRKLVGFHCRSRRFRSFFIRGVIMVSSFGQKGRNKMQSSANFTRCMFTLNKLLVFLIILLFLLSAILFIRFGVKDGMVLLNAF
mmetsp:Transcript_8139/g.12479  ORF Transcript_8139/g.12479 Transcript_8139/m.12479 type:complete len:246 (+) Transcript_8139:1173-1910(+)